MEQADKKEKVTKKSVLESAAILVGYLKRYRKETIALSLFGIISAIGNGVVPIIAGRFFDSIITPGTIAILHWIVPMYAFLLAIWALVQIVAYFVDWQINIRSENFSNTVWVDYWSHGIGYLLKLPMSFHKAKKVGEIGEKINRAAFGLETIIGRIVIDLAPQFLSIVIALGVAFYLQAYLALVLVIGITVYAFVLYRSVAPLADIQREYQTHLYGAFGDSYDLFGNAQAIKQATAEEYEAERLGGLLKGPVLSLWARMNKIWSTLTLSQRIIVLVTQLVVFIASVYFIHKGQMSVGDLLAFNAYATMVFGPFVVVGRNWQTIQNGIIQLEEAEAVLREPAEAYHPAGSDPEFRLRGDVRFDHVSFHYDEKKTTLTDIDFEVKAGEIVALVGESGVGKSTLIDLMSGYHMATEGRVLIDGRPIESLDLVALRSQIGVVPQEVVLFNDTILHNIRYGSWKRT
ncbi:MAG: ABC transporter ATP-binding protein, partial [Candidatus Paceibacterota bacterium]